MFSDDATATSAETDLDGPAVLPIQFQIRAFRGTPSTPVTVGGTHTILRSIDPF